MVDASALFGALVGWPSATLRERLLGSRQSLHAPHLIDVEIAQTTRRLVAIGEIEELRARAVLRDLADLRLHRYPHETLLGRIWAMRGNLTAYDAAYVALAEALDAPLLTRDQRMASAPGHMARVELV